MGWHKRQIPVGNMFDCLSHNVKCLLHGAWSMEQVGKKNCLGIGKAMGR